MPLKQSLLTLALSAALTHAVSNELPSVYLLNLTPVPLVGSIIATDATATTYEIACTPASASPLCGFAHGATYVSADNELTFWHTDAGTTFSGECTLTTPAPSTTSAVCTTEMDGLGSGFPNGITRVGTSAVDYMIPLTVTGGLPTGTANSEAETETEDQNENEDEEDADESADPTPTGGVARVSVSSEVTGLGFGVAVAVVGVLGLIL
ncbi:hypothetical protein BJX63DRAFT_381343 [Aspergillus granulosus]|uniref:GPI anchored protein n=1 Tax=Aspergillus granulosus TaxID=176169 RepID=A0ABR4HX71_9EURO